LFLIYINDFHEVVETEGCSLFADDAKLYAITDRNTATDQSLARSLRNVHEWSQTWQLSLSIPKCTVFCFGKSNIAPNYSIDGNPLVCENEVVDLGVTLSHTGKTSSHCTLKSQKGLQVVGHIFRSFRSRNQKFLLNMFRTYVRPIVDYNSPAWTPHLKKDVMKIERVQRNFTKRIPGMSRYSYTERLRILKLNSLEETRIKSDLIMAFRMLKKQVDLNFNDFFEFAPELGTRGHSLKLRIQHNRLDSTKYFFSNRVPHVWNSLPDALVTAPSVDVFKARLKEVDLSRFLRFIGEQTET
jgi:hypothetical protein